LDINATSSSNKHQLADAAVAAAAEATKVLDCNFCIIPHQQQDVSVVSMSVAAGLIHVGFLLAYDAGSKSACARIRSVSHHQTAAVVR